MKTSYGVLNLGYNKLRFNSIIKNASDKKILVEDVPEYWMGAYYPLELKPGNHIQQMLLIMRDMFYLIFFQK